MLFVYYSPEYKQGQIYYIVNLDKVSESQISKGSREGSIQNATGSLFSKSARSVSFSPGALCCNVTIPVLRFSHC